MGHIWRELLRYIDRMGTWEWSLALAAMIVVAVICMRGYGSRSRY